ncbi:MBL fold metallo-hydrolase [Streptomyces sp. NPDC059262]|uniref:MBL fold metallo-hydrolase n=1 Tax=Streptomyces sp. NPDC059262 TaxID=3346797 RepID=UPI00369B9C36
MGNGQHVTSNAAGTRPRSVTVRLVGGPTALLEIAGLRPLTDPTCDTAVSGAARPLVADDSRPIHTVLISHHRHTDGLDAAGRRLFATVPMTLTTAAAADRPGRNATALPAWYHLTLDRPDGDSVKVTGVPVQHGPDGSEHVTGGTTGFTSTGTDMPTPHISSGNTSLEIFTAMVERFDRVGLALLPVDAARTPTQNSSPMPTGDQAAESATPSMLVGSSPTGGQLLAQRPTCFASPSPDAPWANRLTVLGTVSTASSGLNLHGSGCMTAP